MEREEGGSGWGTHVNPWLIYVSVWQKTLHYYKVISLELIKISEKKKKKKNLLCNTGDLGSISGQGTKIPDAMGQPSPCVTTAESCAL